MCKKAINQKLIQLVNSNKDHVVQTLMELVDLSEIIKCQPFQRPRFSRLFVPQLIQEAGYMVVFKMWS